MTGTKGLLASDGPTWTAPSLKLSASEAGYVDFLVLDVTGGKMYWTDHDGYKEGTARTPRANLDGPSLKLSPQK